MTSTTCEACQRCFRSAQRLQQHLQRLQVDPQGCFFILQQHMDPVDPATTEGLNEILPELRHVHRLPAVDALGASALPATTCWERQQQFRLHLIETQ